MNEVNGSEPIDVQQRNSILSYRVNFAKKSNNYGLDLDDLDGILNSEQGFSPIQENKWFLRRLIYKKYQNLVQKLSKKSEKTLGSQDQEISCNSKTTEKSEKSQFQHRSMIPEALLNFGELLDIEKAVASMEFCDLKEIDYEGPDILKNEFNFCEETEEIDQCNLCESFYAYPED
ncbi:MAG: hypothetical protein MHPSP_000626 [Paramarteilia canceri]